MCTRPTPLVPPVSYLGIHNPRAVSPLHPTDSEALMYTRLAVSLFVLAVALAWGEVSLWCDPEPKLLVGLGYVSTAASVTTILIRAINQ